MNLRTEALHMLEKRGAVLETAVKLSQLMKESRIDGAVIGGVAVVLHGHVRTTRDVDLLIRQPLADCKPILEKAGLRFDPMERAFLCEGVPVHRVPLEMVSPQPRAFIEIEGVTTVRLADLISMKLHSGTSNILRAQDLADVIGLIRQHKLGQGFARMIDRPVRAEFKRLAEAVEREK